MDGIFISDDKKTIQEYNSQFDKLRTYFISPNGKFKGKIRDMIEKNAKSELLKDIFSLPENVNAEHKDSWIRDYPDGLCSGTYTKNNGLFITPFDAKGRDFIGHFIGEAEQFVYIATESFTDPSFPSVLIKTALRGVKVYVLAGVTSRDFTDRLQNNIREMLAAGINVRVFDGNIHAKMIVTDKGLLIGSMNLNMINLGFSKKKGLWRENTETLAQCRDGKIIETARKKYEHVFNNKSIKVEDKLVDKLEKEAVTKLCIIFGITLEREVRHHIAMEILAREETVKSFTLQLGKAIKQLVEKFGKKKVDMEIFYMALILYDLSERKRSLLELKSIMALKGVGVNELLEKLIEKKLILREGEFYKRSLV